MNNIETMKLALEALIWANKEINEWMDDQGLGPIDHPKIMSAITALLQAIEQAQVATNDTSQERVVEIAKQRHEPCGLECDCTDVCKQDNYKALWQQMCERCDALDKQLAQQKPVACDCDSPAWCTQYKKCNRTMLGLMPYVSQPKRTWVEIDGDDWIKALEMADFDTVAAFEFFANKIKELNT